MHASHRKGGKSETYCLSFEKENVNALSKSSHGFRVKENDSCQGSQDQEPPQLDTQSQRDSNQHFGRLYCSFSMYAMVMYMYIGE